MQTKNKQYIFDELYYNFFLQIIEVCIVHSMSPKSGITLSISVKN